MSDPETDLVYTVWTAVVCGLILVTAVLNTATIIYGIATWIKFPVWRQFRHYVFMNILVIITPLLGLFAFISKLWPNIEQFTLRWCSLAFTHWMLVSTVMFYIDFVNVFVEIDTIPHLYLKANIVGYLLPFVWAALWQVFDAQGLYISFGFLGLVPVINIILYLRVLCALFKKSRQAHGESDMCKKIVIASFAFVFTGSAYIFVIILLPILLIPDDVSPYVIMFLIICSIITHLLINVFFLMLKSHRALWAGQANVRADSNS